MDSKTFAFNCVVLRFLPKNEMILSINIFIVWKGSASTEGCILKVVLSLAKLYPHANWALKLWCAR